jgi:histidinol phosphatase-like enzyme (inositol monophosphatase family)
VKVSASSEPEIAHHEAAQDPRLVAAVAAARAAGEVARRYFGTGIRVEWKGEGASRSPVTAADREAEQAARAVIAARFPAHGFLGEEFGETGARDARWILDPIDGTDNFIRGIPLFGALVALEEGGRITVAAAYNPILDEMVSAVGGGGAYRNGTPIRVSDRPALAESLVVHSSVGEFVRRGIGDRVRDGEPGGGKSSGIQRLLAAAGRDRGFGDYFGYVLVATGRAEVMLEAKAQPWDLAAPKLVVEEAGGRFTSLTGEDTIYSGAGLATNGRLHDEVLALLGTRSLG